MNLEYVSEDRNKAAHLVLDRVTPNILAIYQACVINYHSSLQDWFGISLSDRVSVGMMTIVFDLSLDNFDLTNRTLRRTLGADALDYLLRRQKEIEEFQEQTGYATEFAAEIRHSVHIANNPNNASIQLARGSTGTEIGIVDKPRDPAVTHPFRTKDVVIATNAKLGGRYTINNYDILCVTTCHRTKSNDNHYFRSHIPASPSQYSESFVEWIIAKFDKDLEFFKRCRESNRQQATSSSKR